MTVLGLRFCVRAFSSCGKWGPLFITVRGPLTVAASLVEEHRLQTRRLSNCGSRAQLLGGMWDLPRPGLERVSPALAGRFSTTAPPGKPGEILNWGMLPLQQPPTWSKLSLSLLFPFIFPHSPKVSSEHGIMSTSHLCFHSLTPIRYSFNMI